MPTYASAVENAIEKYKAHELIIAADLYLEIKKEVPETAFYKNLERMCKAKLLIHLTKGIYYKPKKSSFGEIPISTEQIVKERIEDGANEKAALRFPITALSFASISIFPG